MDERLYSRPLDVHRISEYPEVQNVINSLLSELNDSNLIKNSPRKRILKHLKVVILDLYVSYMGDPLVYVSYPRSKDAYRQDQRIVCRQTKLDRWSADLRDSSAHQV